jgi:hypothetical protein
MKIVDKTSKTTENKLTVFDSHQCPPLVRPLAFDLYYNCTFNLKRINLIQKDLSLFLKSHHNYLVVQAVVYVLNHRSQYLKKVKEKRKRKNHSSQQVRGC